MKFSSQWLKEMEKEKDFLICIDSDGCAFDTMEVKHKECFIPNIINEWDLQAISKYAREAAEFVNLYSKWRGINRFPALINVMDLLAEREEVKKRGFKVPNLDLLRKWTVKETKLGNPALEAYVEKTKDPLLTKTLKWSIAVNDTVARIVRGVPPFPFVRESLDKMVEFADVIVVSATPGEALIREWEEHDISKYVKIMAGQEMGTKAECIGYAKDEDIEYALESTVTTIFLLREDIFTIEKNVQNIKDKNKSVFVHIELLEGLGRDNRAIDYLTEVIRPNGIITTRTGQVKYAREKGIYTIQRFFLVDSQSYETAIKSVQSVKPDMIEIMPAVMPGIIGRFSKDVSLPVIAGGLIDSKNDIIEALKAGALGASTGKKELWNC
jgi:glycerol-3-phosphate responsive antiterminator